VARRPVPRHTFFAPRPTMRAGLLSSSPIRFTEPAPRRGSIRARVVALEQHKTLEVCGIHSPVVAAPASGLRLVTTRQGFWLMRKDGTRKYASASQVVRILLAKIGEADQLLTGAARANALELVTLDQSLRSCELQEGEATRKLLMLIGPPIEHAVTAAVAASSGVLATRLARARRASTVAEAPLQVPAFVYRPTGYATASGSSAGARVSARGSILRRRRSSGRLVRSKSQARLSSTKPIASNEAEGVGDSFTTHETVRRAQILLLRAARRQEAAMVIQVTWRVRQHGFSARTSARASTS